MCNTMELGSNSSHTEFFLSNNGIQTTCITKDLGAQFESNLKFKACINDSMILLVAPTSGQLLFIAPSCLVTHNLILAFKTYVRPLLDYVSLVWSPTHVMLIRAMLRVVQRRFTKRLLGMLQFPYSERLTQLGLQSLNSYGFLNTENRLFHQNQVHKF